MRKSVLLGLFLHLFSSIAYGDEPSPGVSDTKYERLISLISQLDSNTFMQRSVAYRELHEEGLSALFLIEVEKKKGVISTEHSQNLRNLENSIRRSYIYRPVSINGDYYGTINQVMEQIGYSYDTPLPFLKEDTKNAASYSFVNVPFWQAIMSILDDNDIGINYDQQYKLNLVRGRISEADKCIVGPYLFARIQDENQYQSKIIFLANQRQYPLPQFNKQYRVLGVGEGLTDMFGRGLSHKHFYEAQFEIIDVDGFIVGYLIKTTIPPKNVIIQMRSNYRIRESHDHALPGTYVMDPFWFEVSFESR